MKQRLLLWLFLLCCFAIQAQLSPTIASGPMPGYTTMNEVAIWLQTNDEVSVQLEYWNVLNINVKLKSNLVSTRSIDGNTARFVLANLEPGQAYGYRVLINGNVAMEGTDLVVRTQSFWQFRTEPPTFTVAMGSCAYVNEDGHDRPGKAYGSGYVIFERIADQKPDMMLWLGDNIYLREPDWGSRSGYIHRYTHARSTKELQPLLRGTHHYALWDDHDYGPNDAIGSWPGKELARESFNLFWMNPPPMPGMEGITTSFRFNDIDFFLLDNRWYRTSAYLKTAPQEMLGTKQIDWLINALKYSHAPFKLIAVGGQVLNPARVHECYANYESERATLLRRISEEGIEGVVFLTGDRHHTELSLYQSEGGPVMYDLTVSPLTSGVHTEEDEANTLRVDSTLVTQHNFATLEFSGPRNSRVMKITIRDTEGKQLWTQSIAQPRRKP